MPNSDAPTSHGVACCVPVAREPISDARVREAVVVFKALADPVRLRIVSIITTQHDGEACVCQLVSAFSLSQPTISHHLRVLREAKVLDAERRGTWIYYSVVPGTLAWVTALLDGAR